MTFVDKLILILLLLPLISANLEINEIMYAPIDGNEWIELYNPTNNSINLTLWELSDNTNTDQLICCSSNIECSLELQPQSYAIITDQDTTLYDSLETDALKICVDDNALGNGLSNSGDFVLVSFEGYEFKMEFTGDFANKNGFTLELEENFLRESYIEGGTPGMENSRLVKEEITTEKTKEKTQEEIFSSEKEKSETKKIIKEEQKEKVILNVNEETTTEETTTEETTTEETTTEETTTEETTTEKEQTHLEHKPTKNEINNHLTGEVIYQSKNQKIKKFIPYLLLVILSFTSIFYILKE